MSESDKYVKEHLVTFSETRWYQRLWAFLGFLPKEVPLFATVAISTWGVAEILSQAVGETLDLKRLAVPVLAVSLITSAFSAIQKYRVHLPESLSSESKAAQKIFRRSASGWQFALARQMLLDRIAVSDAVLVRIESGAEYIPPKTIEQFAYIDWLGDRPRILLRLVRAITVQCISEIPSILATSTGEKSLPRLKESIAQLASLYKVASDFEMESRSVEPPEEYAEVHEMIFGWSAPVRKGVQDFVKLLATIATIDPRAVRRGSAGIPSLMIKLDPPSNVAAFCEKLESLRLYRAT